MEFSTLFRLATRYKYAWLPVVPPAIIDDVVGVPESLHHSYILYSVRGTELIVRGGRTTGFSPISSWPEGIQFDWFNPYHPDMMV